MIFNRYFSKMHKSNNIYWKSLIKIHNVQVIMTFTSSHVLIVIAERRSLSKWITTGKNNYFYAFIYYIRFVFYYFSVLCFANLIIHYAMSLKITCHFCQCEKIMKLKLNNICWRIVLFFTFNFSPPLYFNFSLHLICDIKKK